ncbi:c-type cytochrome [Aliiglaciecola sp. LCG003]|uniref:c-type cytochrome n=1 Tax=Aliiglaciecola sp. LCG003 TaxID=3053655 RepID=UPI0025743C45|nr:c-type cytochrome [Aliiglaciecola sp. LCG003]WJG09529.1 c-type cytochrome [Aliiglaciecola sp. LCG003]
MKLKALLSVFAGSLLMFAVQAQDMSEDAIANRIKAVGSVHVAGAQAATSSAGPRSGDEVYKSSCAACHGSGVLGAPKFQVAADWAPRLEKGFDAVWQNAIHGINAMPPKGTCGSCSDDEIKLAIEHMIEGI